MNTTTTYKISRGGQFGYFFWAVFLCGSGLILLSAFFTEGAKAQNHGWLVYIFGGLVTLLWLGYGLYCALRAFKHSSRVIVDCDGFLYEGIIKTSRFEWHSITKIRRNWGRNQQTGDWLDIVVKGENKKPRTVRLDFSGLEPDYRAFMGQVTSLAPWVEVKSF